MASVFVGTACLSPGWARGAAAAVCRDQCREESQHPPCPSYQSCPPAGRVSAMDSHTQWDAGAEFGTGCRRKGGQAAEKGTGMCAAMLDYKPVTLQQDMAKKMSLKLRCVQSYYQVLQYFKSTSNIGQVQFTKLQEIPGSKLHY